MQDTSSLSVKAKFNFGAAAAGQERGLQRLKSTAAADMKSAEEGNIYIWLHNSPPMFDFNIKCIDIEYSLNGGKNKQTLISPAFID